MNYTVESVESIKKYLIGNSVMNQDNLRIGHAIIHTIVLSV